jgi:hypothetical protein
MHRKAFMKQLRVLAYVGIAFLGLSVVGNAQQLLTFDDLPTPSSGPGGPDYGPIPNGYGGLNWGTFNVIDGLAVNPATGYYTGVVSPSNVIFNVYGEPATISNPHGLFDLDSAYLTAGLNLSTPLNIEVQGFNGATMLYDNTYTVYNTGPTLVNFNYNGINSVTFITSPPQQLAMDNLMVTVPEPPVTGLLGIGAVALLAFRRR